MRGNFRKRHDIRGPESVTRRIAPLSRGRLTNPGTAFAAPLAGNAAFETISPRLAANSAKIAGPGERRLAENAANGFNLAIMSMTAEELKQNGQKLFKYRQFAEAIPLLKSAVEAFPKDETLWQELVMAATDIPTATIKNPNA